MDSSDLIAAGDALNDPRTASLGPGYLRVLGITSMLDVPLHARGLTTGVLCCEHTGPARPWASDEQTFAVAVANLVSMLFAQLEQQRLEAQLRQTQKLEALGTLAGGIAHDFNNILGAIISFTELSKLDHPHDAELQDNLAQVLKAADRAAGLVRQILAFSRQQQQERKPIELGPVVREALALIRSTLPATIEIEAAVPDRLPAVLADATQMHQVIMNLCANAAHAMRERHGRLRIALEVLNGPGPSPAEGGRLCLTVSDTGEGMAPVTLHRIFDPFFTTKAPGEGTGLGLAVVHGIVNEHEGEIQVESEPGLGSTFRILLPVASSDSQDAAADRSAVTSAGHRILFVDDEPSLGRAASGLLTRMGFQVEVTNSPRDALALFRERPGQFDAVVTDLTMPGMTGLELAGQILKLQPGIPVYLMTGYTGHLTEDVVRSVGIRQLVAKPLEFRLLAQLLTNALTPPVARPHVAPDDTPS
jgi:signal transduction histidine kinase/ActR/RegA family two-component response regulator